MINFRSSKSLVLLSLLSLTVTACQPPVAPTEPTESTAPVTTPASPETPSESAPSETETDTTQLTLKIQGSEDLRGFVVQQQSQGICLSQLTQLDTSLTLPEAPDAAMKAALEANGATVEENKVKISSALANLDALISGVELSFSHLPEGEISGVTNLQNEAGATMGSLSYKIKVEKGSNTVTLMLTSAGVEANPNGCVPLLAEVVGGTLTSTAGGLLVEAPDSDSPDEEPGESEETPDEEPAPDNTPLPPNVSGIRITTDNRFITFQGETRQLKAALLDNAGNEVSAEGAVIEWLSNRPQDLSIDSEGNIVALVGLGYSQVTARIVGTQIQDSILFDITDPSFFTNTTTFIPDSKPAVVGQFQVNGEGDERPPGFWSSVAMDDDGDYVVVWNSKYEGIESSVIHAQRYNSEGKTVGEVIEVSQESSAFNTFPDVAMDDDGDFVVTWTSKYESAPPFFAGEIKYRVYDKNGNPKTDEETVALPIDTIAPLGASVAMDGSGDFVLSFSAKYDEEAIATLAQRYDQDGEIASSLFEIALPDTNSVNGFFPDVAMDDNGNFVVVFSADFDGDGADFGRFVRTVSADDDMGELALIEGSDGTSNFSLTTSVSMDNEGDFVVAWNSKYQDRVRAQRFHANGDPRGDLLEVNDGVSGDFDEEEFARASVAMDRNGNFAVVWDEYDLDSEARMVYMRQYDSSGNPEGPAVRVNDESSSETAMENLYPDVAMDRNGDFVVTWSYDSEDERRGKYFDILGKRYDSNGDEL